MAVSVSSNDGKTCPSLLKWCSKVRATLLILILLTCFCYFFTGYSRVRLPEVHKNLTALFFKSVMLNGNSSGSKIEECAPLHELIKRPVSKKLEITDKPVIERKGNVKQSDCPNIMNNFRRNEPVMNNDDKKGILLTISLPFPHFAD